MQYIKGEACILYIIDHLVKPCKSISLSSGNDAGVVQLVNVYSGQIEKEFKLFMSPVK